MKNARALFLEMVSRVRLPERPEEVQAIIYLLFEDVFGISRTEILAGKMVPYDAKVAAALEGAIERINLHEPVQYVLGRESFYGRNFQVNTSVLIPRPETEELIRLVLLHGNEKALQAGTRPPLRVLDIGTGSGCIAITLSLELGRAEVFATDVSAAALSVASENAELLNAPVTFFEHNILREKLPLQGMDVIVSNPPYVTSEEKSAMQPAVAAFEPHLALFVPDDDPLLFYRHIVLQAREALSQKALLAVEVNEGYAQDVSDLFSREGFTEVRITKDIAGKDRIVSALNDVVT
jgi:release factor glutamine methyltransferase